MNVECHPHSESGGCERVDLYSLNSGSKGHSSLGMPGGILLTYDGDFAMLI